MRSQEPNQRRNIISALMVGHKDQATVFWKTVGIVESTSSAKKTKAANEEKIKVINCFTLSRNAKKIKTHHLNGMENHKQTTKKQIVD